MPKAKAKVPVSAMQPVARKAPHASKPLLSLVPAVPIESEKELLALSRKLASEVHEGFEHYKTRIPPLSALPALTPDQLDKVYEDCFHVRLRGDVGLSPEDLEIAHRAEKILRDSGFYDDESFDD